MKPFTVLFIVTVFSSVACDEKNEEKQVALAQLIDAAGRIERDFFRKVGIWKPAQLGSRFYLGDGVRSGSDSSAVLQLVNGSHFGLNPKSQIRFLKSLRGLENNRLELDRGETKMVTFKNSLRVEIGPALTVINPRSKAHLKRRKDSLDFRVEIGEATIYLGKEKQGQPRSLIAGEAVRLQMTPGRKPALIDLPKSPSESTNAEPLKRAATSEKIVIDSGDEDTYEVTEEIVSESETANRHQIAYREFSSADFPVAAGQSFVVHATKLPVYVGIRVPKECEGETYLSLGKNQKPQYRGMKQINVQLSSGKNRYFLICSEKAGAKTRIAAKGTIFVHRSQADYKLPRSAPHSFVEVDGRTYKIIFQHLLPTVILSWRNAPEASSYKVHLISNGNKRKTRKTAGPSFTFASGQLEEGLHKVKFEAMEAVPRFSRTTQIDIKFNNVSPKAVVTSPEEGGFGSGDLVEVKGMALVGWSATVLGGDVEMDKHFRFSGKVRYTGEYAAIAVRLTHPQHGVHYYLRRSLREARD
jgi:hypothetical protein